MARQRRSRSTASEPPSGTLEVPEEAARRAAYRYLARTARSASEVEAHLARRGFPPAVVAPTVRALRDLRYVDDAALASRCAEELLVRRGCGRLRVVYELTRRGLADSVIETAIAVILDGRGDEELAREALGRKLQGRPLLGARDRARVFRLLTGRGHPADVVGEILEEGS